MITNSAIFACGGPSGGILLIIFAVLALWIVSAAFFLANFCLLFALRDKHLVFHGIATLIYALFGLAAYSQIKAGVPDQYLWWLGGAVGLPPIVIGHFIWLVRLVRRERRAVRLAARPS